MHVICLCLVDKDVQKDMCSLLLIALQSSHQVNCSELLFILLCQGSMPNPVYRVGLKLKLNLFDDVANVAVNPRILRCFRYTDCDIKQVQCSWGRLRNRLRGQQQLTCLGLNLEERHVLLF